MNRWYAILAERILPIGKIFRNMDMAAYAGLFCNPDTFLEGFV
jgi:hypothetical protein